MSAPAVARASRRARKERPQPGEAPVVDVLDPGGTGPVTGTRPIGPGSGEDRRPRPRRRRRGPDDIHPRPGRIHGLDGLRALAILGVLVFHFTPALLPGGFLGVDVFLVISGFLITTLLLRELAANGRLDLPQFWLRRARRLLPALAVVVVVSIGAARLVGGDLLVNIGRQALGALTFSTNWLEIEAGASYFNNTSPLLFVNFWSLAVEEQFYLLWPLGLVFTLALTSRTRQRLWVVLGLAAASAAAMALLYRPGEDATRVYYGTDTHLFGLMLGVALAFAWAGPERAGLRTSTWRRWRGPAVIGAFGLLVSLMAFLDEHNPWTFRGGILLACIATAVLIAGLLESGSVWRTAMQARPLGWLGARSYGIYLWHWPVLMIALTLFPVAEGSLTGWIVLLAALVVTLGVSALSYRFIEIPVRRHGFRASLAGLKSWAGTPWAVSRLPRVAAGALAGVMLLAAVAVATAPDKSETQRAIEASEAELNGRADGAVGQQPAGSSAPEMAVGEPEDGAEEKVLGGLLGSITAREVLDWRSTGAETTESSGSGGGTEGDTEGGESEAAEGEGAKGEGAEGEGEKGQGSGGQDPKGEAPGGEDTKGDGGKAAGSGPFGYSKDDDGLWVPAGRDLTAIGDSLVVTSADGLKWRFEGMNFEAQSNRQWKDALPVLEDALADGTVRDNVIVHFGTNAGVDEAVLRAFLVTLGPDRQVVVVNLYGSSSFVPESNAIIAEVVKDFPNAVVGDWQAFASAQPHTLQSDRIHPDIEGMHVYAEMVATSFDQLARRHSG